jgi:hypothetical protein
MVLDPSGYKDVTQDPEVMVSLFSLGSGCLFWGTNGGSQPSGCVSQAFWFSG